MRLATGAFVGTTIALTSGSGSAVSNLAGYNLETGGGTSSQDAAFLCKPNYITSRLEDQIVYLRALDGSAQDFWLKSHPQYPELDYPHNLNCYVSFRTRYSPNKQYLKFEVQAGAEVAGDAFLAFGNDYGDLEK